MFLPNEPISPAPEVRIVQERDARQLLALPLAHNPYYPLSPIFVRQPVEPGAVLAELQAQAREGESTAASRRMRRPPRALRAPYGTLRAVAGGIRV